MLKNLEENLRNPCQMLILLINKKSQKLNLDRQVLFQVKQND
jgi:hypothetical protein